MQQEVSPQKKNATTTNNHNTKKTYIRTFRIIRWNQSNLNMLLSNTLDI